MKATSPLNAHRNPRAAGGERNAVVTLPVLAAILATQPCVRVPAAGLVPAIERLADVGLVTGLKIDGRWVFDLTRALKDLADLHDIGDDGPAPGGGAA